jgi:hypothetical protein
MNQFDLLIDSRDRESDSVSSTNYMVKFNREFKHVERVRLNWVSIPLTSYLINSGNNVITFFENSTVKTATLTSKNYTATQLASEIKSKLDTASGGHNTYTVTYDDQTFKITFSAGNAFELRWSVAGSPAKICGFELTDTASGTSVTSTNAVYLNRPNLYNLIIRPFSKMIYTTNDQALDSSFILELENQRGSTEVLKPFFPREYLSLSNPKTVDYLHIKLQDQYGDSVDLNGAEIQFHLTLYSKDDQISDANCACCHFNKKRRMEE